MLTVAGIAVGGLVAYAVYFDYRRRTDANFRKQLRTFFFVTAVAIPQFSVLYAVQREGQKARCEEPDVFGDIRELWWCGGERPEECTGASAERRSSG